MHPLSELWRGCGAGERAQRRNRIATRVVLAGGIVCLGLGVSDGRWAHPLQNSELTGVLSLGGALVLRARQEVPGVTAGREALVASVLAFLYAIPAWIVVGILGVGLFNALPGLYRALDEVLQALPSHAFWRHSIPFLGFSAGVLCYAGAFGYVLVRRLRAGRAAAEAADADAAAADAAR